MIGPRGEQLLAPRRRPSLVGNVVGLVLAVVGVAIAVASGVAIIDGGDDAVALGICGVVTWAVGSVLWRTTIIPRHIRIVDVYITVTVAWLVMIGAGAIPYLATRTLTDVDMALFEAVSGFTTTGATVISDIEAVSHGTLFWRSTTQWLGGMGVIVLVVAVLPTIGAGGMNLIQAEAPGPTGERLTPRVRETARNLWKVYLGFTVVLAVAYAVAGMNLYDSVSHSFTTVSTGGFSPYQGSLGHFDSGAIEWIAIVAMFLAGGSFTLYFRALRKDPKPLLRSTELKVYVLLVLSVAALVALSSGSSGGQSSGVRDALFTTTSVITTTGYVTSEYGLWSQAAQSILLLVLPFGAMAGSTAGGVKIVRIMAVASYAHREGLRQLHPRLVRPVRVGTGIVPDDVAAKIVGFMLLALGVFGGGAIVIAFTGADLVTSFSASATSFGNVGPGFGALDHTGDFTALEPPARVVAMGQMLLGRLEIYPVILALSVFTLRLPLLTRRIPRRKR